MLVKSVMYTEFLVWGGSITYTNLHCSQPPMGWLICFGVICIHKQSVVWMYLWGQSQSRLVLKETSLTLAGKRQQVLLQKGCKGKQSLLKFLFHTPGLCCCLSRNRSNTGTLKEAGALFYLQINKLFHFHCDSSYNHKFLLFTLLLVLGLNKYAT